MIQKGRTKKKRAEKKREPKKKGFLKFIGSTSTIQQESKEFWKLSRENIYIHYRC